MNFKNSLNDRIPIIVKKELVFEKITKEKSEENTTNQKAARYAALGIGTASKFGNVTERRSSKEKASPKKCDSIVLADA